MFADSATDEVGGGVGGPGDDEGEEEKFRPVRWNAMQANGERERKGDKKKRAGANARSGERFDQGATCPESEDGEPNDKSEKKSDRRIKKG